MKNEELYYGMTKEVAKRYLETRKTIEKSIIILEGVRSIFKAIEEFDDEAIEIKVCGIGLIGELIDRQGYCITRSLDKEFIDEELLKKAVGDEEMD